MLNSINLNAGDKLKNNDLIPEVRNCVPIEPIVNKCSASKDPAEICKIYQSTNTEVNIDEVEQKTLLTICTTKLHRC